MSSNQSIEEEQQEQAEQAENQPQDDDEATSGIPEGWIRDEGNNASLYRLIESIPNDENYYVSSSYYVNNPLDDANSRHLLLTFQRDLSHDTTYINPWIEMAYDIPINTDSLLPSSINQQDWTRILSTPFQRREASLPPRERTRGIDADNYVLYQDNYRTSRPKPPVEWDPQEPLYYYNAYGANVNIRAGRMFQWRTGIIRMTDDEWFVESQRSWREKYYIRRTEIGRNIRNNKRYYRYTCNCPQFEKYPLNSCKHIIYTNDMLYRSKGYRPR